MQPRPEAWAGSSSSGYLSLLFCTHLEGVGLGGEHTSTQVGTVGRGSEQLRPHPGALVPCPGPSISSPAP